MADAALAQHGRHAGLGLEFVRRESQGFGQGAQLREVHARDEGQGLKVPGGAQIQPSDATSGGVRRVAVDDQDASSLAEVQSGPGAMELRQDAQQFGLGAPHLGVPDAVEPDSLDQHAQETDDLHDQGPFGR